MVFVAPARAAVVKPFTLGYNKIVYGDFLEIGNAALRCPVTADSAPSIGYTPANCASAQARSGPAATSQAANDSYFLKWNDVDTDATTFDSSRSTVTVPPGASIDFAQLNWAGNTGRFRNILGTGYVGANACGNNYLTAPANLPPGSYATVKPRLTVGAAGSVDVTGTVTVDPDSAVGAGQPQYYSGYADVTTALQNIPTGTAVPITVGNIWAPEGFNCMGGWSLVIVYKYVQRDPVNAPASRAIYIYNGHVRQQSTDPATTVTVSGFRMTGGSAKVGVTAYEGDWGISGDAFAINGTAVTDGSGLPATNYFGSYAQGAVNPGVTNNFSVDAKSQSTSLIPSGSTSAQLSFSTTGDSYLAQNLVFSLPIPEVLITKTASPSTVHAGDPVTFTITVANPGGAPAKGVVVNDVLYGACNRNIGTLPGGASVTYTCTGTAGANTFTNTATVSGRSNLDDPLSGSAAAAVTVVHPAIDITKTTDKAGYRPGDTVTYTITVTNTGDTGLAPVTVVDPKTASCATTRPSLAAGASFNYTCTGTAPVPDNSNTASVSGTDIVGGTVTDSATAAVTAIAPGLSITKSVAPGVIRGSGTATWTIAVTNSGDSLLKPVAVVDDTTPACNRTLADGVAAGATVTYTCTATVAATTTNTVTATGTDLSGRTLTATATATVTVINPALEITKTTDDAAYRAGDTVTFTITVHNVGDVPLTNVGVSDPQAGDCTRAVTAGTATLAAGASLSYTCTAVAGTTSTTNVAAVSGTPVVNGSPSGGPVTASASAPVTVINPAIALTKTADPSVARVGEQVSFTLVVSNTGDTALTDVVVDDPDAAGCAQTIGALAVGASRTVTCTVTAGTDSFTNTATVTGSDTSGQPVTASATAAVTVIHPALTLSKTATPAVVEAGDTVTYTVVVTNSGDATLTDVVVSDPDAPACGATVSALLAGQSRTITCTATAGVSSFSNTATVTATAPHGPDVTATDTAAVTVIHPGIAITKTASATAVHSGDPVTFTVTVTNTGDATLTDVVVTDATVPGCAFTVASLAAGASDSRTCTVSAGDGALANTATVTASTPTGRSIGDTASATVAVLNPAIAVTKTTDRAQYREGDPITFTITVTNVGNVTLGSVEITDAIAPDCARTLPDPLAVGASVAITCALIAPQNDLVNTASVSGTDSLGRTVSASADATVDIVHPALTVSKSFDPSTAPVGGTITVNVTVVNSGDVALSDVSVSESDPRLAGTSCEATGLTLAASESRQLSCTTTVPAADYTNTVTAVGTPPIGPDVSASATANLTAQRTGLTITKTASAPVVRSGDPVTFTITVTNTGDVTLDTVVVDPSFAQECNRTVGTLAASGLPGDSVSYQCTVTAPLGDVVNTAIANGTPVNGPPVTATDTATVQTIQPGLRVVKTGPAAPVRVGDTVTYTIDVTNVGDVDLTDVRVADPLAADCDRVIGLLAAQGNVTYTCTGTAFDDDYTNVATASGTDPLGNATSAQDDAPVDVIHPAIALTKTADAATVRVGSTVTFTLTVTNTGDSDLTAVTISDDRAPDCSRVIPGVLAAGASTTVTCTAAAGTDTFTNTASVSATPVAGAPVTAEGSATVTVVHPGVSVAKSVDQDTVHAGDTVTFTITVTNTGDVALGPTAVSDPVAPNCGRTFSALAVSEVQRYTCTLQVGSADLVNVARVSAAAPVGDPVTGRSTDVPVTVLTPHLTVTKTADPVTAHAGDTVTFTIVVVNDGNAALSDLTIADPAAPGCAQSIATFGVGASRTISCTVTAGPDDFVNTVTVTGTDPIGGPVTAGASAAVDVIHPQLQLTKAASPTVVHAGDSVSFTITVVNIGDVDLTAVTVADAMSGDCVRTIGALGVGQSTQYTCTMTAPGSSFTNTAVVSGTDPTDVVTTASGSATVIVIHPALTITKTASPAIVRVGDTVTFTVVVTNTGDSTLTDVVVSDPLASGCAASFASLAPNDPQVLTCTLSAPAASFTNRVDALGTDQAGAPVSAGADADVTVIHPGLSVTKTVMPAHPVRAGDPITFTVTVTNTGDVTLTDVSITDVDAPTCSGPVADLAVAEVRTITCTVAAPEGSFTNTASVAALDPSGQPVTGSGSAEVTVIHPGLTLTKTGQQTASLPGDPVRFTLVATNTGDAVLTDLVIEDLQVPGCRFTLATLAPGASTPPYTCTAPMTGSDWHNTATATATDPSGQSIDADGSATVPVGRSGLTVAKTVDRRTAATGQTVTFTITVANTGTVGLRDVRVVDSLVPACSRTVAVLAAGQSQSWSCRYAMGATSIRNTASAQACAATVNAPGCTQPVASAVAVATVERQQSMAETGVPAVRQLGLAVGLLLAGVLLLLGARRRRWS